MTVRESSRLVAIGNFFFHWRNALFPLALLLVLVPGSTVSADPFVALGCGFVIALAGQFVRVFTIGYEYVIRGGRNRRVYAEDLVTGGVYQLCRNPMYVGNLLILCGIAVASNSWSCILIALPVFTFVYVAIVAAEEDYLLGKFGSAFEQYMQDVPRWLPEPGQWLRAVRGGEYHWRRVLMKEYGTPFGWMSMMLVLLMWQLWHAHAMGRRHIAVEIVLAFYGTVMLIWLWLRDIKRTRRMVAD